MKKKIEDKYSFALEEQPVPKEEEVNGEKETNKKDEKSSEKSEPKTPPFVTYGGRVSIVEDDNIIYYKTRYKFLTAMFKLLGKFDSAGRYNIKDEVKLELVKMNKEIKSSNNEGYKAEISFFEKVFEFSVEISTTQEGRAKASLYLNEFVGNALEGGYISTHIADYIDNDDDEFRIRVRRAFNLVDVAFPINEFEVPNIVVLLQKWLDLDLVIGDLFDMASQIYLLRILKLLEETPEGREIVAKYKALLDGSEGDYKRKFAYLRLVLERVIDENGGFEKLPIKGEDKKKLVEDLLSSIQMLKKQTQNQETPIVEVKAEEKKGGASAPNKSPAKKPAKKSAKKDDKKKDGKKAKKSDKKKDDKGKSKGIEPLVFYIDNKKEKNKKEKKPEPATRDNKENPPANNGINKRDEKDELLGMGLLDTGTLGLLRKRERKSPENGGTINLNNSKNTETKIQTRDSTVVIEQNSNARKNEINILNDNNALEQNIEITSTQVTIFEAERE